MTKLGRPPCIPDVVEEHFAELDFLWEQRESVLFAPDWSLEDLAELEERAEAHLDGLRLAALHGVDLARAALAGDEVFSCAAATRVMMATGEPAHADEIVAALTDADAVEEVVEGIRIGLRHCALGALSGILGELTDSDRPAVAAAAIDVLTFQRSPVPLADVQRLVAAEEIPTRVHAFGALGRLRGVNDGTALRELLRSAEPEVVRAALAAAARSGLDGLDALCRTAALDPDHPSVEAMGFLGAVGGPEDLALLEAAARDEECGATAIAALGALGRVQAVPLLIALMGEGAPHAREAAAAYQRITGLDDLQSTKTGPPPTDEAALDDAFDDGFDDSFDDDEPPPDPARAESWWAENAHRFDAAARWKDGVDVSIGIEALWPRAPLSLASWRELQWSDAGSGGGAGLELEATVRSRLSPPR